jgi:hypothetical protein
MEDATTGPTPTSRHGNLAEVLLGPGGKQSNGKEGGQILEPSAVEVHGSQVSFTLLGAVRVLAGCCLLVAAHFLPSLVGLVKECRPL